MVQLITHILINWNRQENQRHKLQQAYFASVMALAMVAGLTTLVNITLGQYIIILAAFLAAVYLTNGLIWALLDAFVVGKVKSLDKKPAKKR